jgi:hypothetical protein
MSADSSENIDGMVHRDDPVASLCLSPRYREVSPSIRDRMNALHIKVPSPERTASSSPVAMVHHVNGYSEQIIDQISKTYERIISLQFLHSYSAKIVSKRQRYIALPSRIISGLIGSGSAMNLIVSYKTFSMSEYVLNILTICGSVISIVDSFSDFGTREVKYKFRKQSLSELAAEVELNMSLMEIDRVDGNQFLRSMISKLGSLSIGNPDFIDGAEKQLSAELSLTGASENFETPGMIHSLKKALTPRATSPMRKVSGRV